MEPYLKISYLNDFIFCPLSIYYHELYGTMNTIIYQGKSQIDGQDAHKKIDDAQYSTHTDILQGISVYSEQLRICGCIDIFDVTKKLLTERKKKIVRIYDGYVFQLYAQYYCLTEMGYEVNALRFHSKDDNRLYPVPLPEEDPKMSEKFFNLIASIREFDPDDFTPSDMNKCKKCIYSNFCDRPLEDLC
ncbi:MAG: type V CRISPR-associated protein Cas4 [Sphaerochaetaceae bacterium]